MGPLGRCKLENESASDTNRRATRPYRRLVHAAINCCGSYDAGKETVAKRPMLPIRYAEPDDLATIVAIYNASIPSRMATADTDPVTVAAREGWFRDFDPARRPLWVAG